MTALIGFRIAAFACAAAMTAGAAMAQDLGKRSTQSRCRHLPIGTTRAIRPRNYSGATRQRRWRPHDRLLLPRMPCRRQASAGQRPGLASHAPLAQSQLGPSRAPRLPRTIRAKGANRRHGQASWSATCRSRGAAPCSPATRRIKSGLTPTSGSRRCPPAADARGTRGDVGDHGRPDGRRRLIRGLDAGAYGHDKGRGEEPQVQRIFVNAAIKKALCQEAGSDRSWLTRSPVLGHDYHFHIRIKCPADSPD